VLFGGHGSKAMLGIAQRLATTQLILICGHNKALAARLRQLPQVAPRLVVEFTADIPFYMRLADFFIGKPGPGSISEAVQQGLPVIVVDNAWTMPQERYNAEWVRENGLGVVHGSFRTIDRAVARLLDGFDTFQASVRRVDNRALFEAPEILDRILRQASEPVRAPADAAALDSA
jgi:UDP-N-acetylglucosamine:LPS N-acetylglucosamine transferase